MNKVERRVRLAQLVYECDSCGACCRHSIIEASHLDAIREPRIQREAALLDGHGKIGLEDASWGLNRREGTGFECVFLQTDNHCGIYSTRPNCCVDFQAGSAKCQMHRESAGLPPLAPRKSAGTMEDRLHILAREDELEGP